MQCPKRVGKSVTYCAFSFPVRGTILSCSIPWSWAVTAWGMGWCRQNEPILLLFLCCHSQGFLFHCIVGPLEWTPERALLELFFFVANCWSLLRDRGGISYSTILVTSLWTVSVVLIAAFSLYCLLVRGKPLNIGKTSKDILVWVLVHIWITVAFSRTTLLQHSFIHYFAH